MTSAASGNGPTACSPSRANSASAPNASGTLREPAMLTPKEIYEKVTAHLLTQRAVSEDESGSCRLRSTQGRKCAIGSLVSDEWYKPAFEGIGISYYRNARNGDLLRAACVASGCLPCRHNRLVDRTRGSSRRHPSRRLAAIAGGTRTKPCFRAMRFDNEPLISSLFFGMSDLT